MTVSVLIATRNRPEDLVLCLKSVLALDYQDYEIVVGDQSTTGDSEAQVRAAFGTPERLRYLRIDAVGKCRALNLLIQQARGDIFACTDDDTVVPPDWLTNIMAAFAQSPKPDILFGPVYPNPDIDRNADVFVPSYEFLERRELKSGDISGMGANMAMRRTAAEKVGHYDVLLGPGAPMHAAEEGDFVYRAHRLDLRVVHDPTIGLMHRAWRDRTQWDRVIYCYGVGDAAFALKHLRCGDWSIAWLLVQKPCTMFLRWCSRLVRFQKNSEGNYLAGYLQGLRLSLQYRVDKQTRLYKPAYRDGTSATSPIGTNS